MKLIVITGLFVVVVSLTFSFFQSGKVYKWEERYDHLVDKKINSIKSFVPLNQLADDYFTNHKEKKYSLIIFFECYCATCVKELVTWEKFFNSEEVKRKINLSLIIKDEMHPYIKNVIRNKNIINYPVFMASEEKLQESGLDFLDNENAILLDKNSRLQFIGSPLVHKAHRRILLGIIN